MWELRKPIRTKFVDLSNPKLHVLNAISKKNFTRCELTFSSPVSDEHICQSRSWKGSQGRVQLLYSGARNKCCTLGDNRFRVYVNGETLLCSCGYSEGSLLLCTTEGIFIVLSGAEGKRRTCQASLHLTEKRKVSRKVFLTMRQNVHGV